MQHLWPGRSGVRTPGATRTVRVLLAFLCLLLVLLSGTAALLHQHSPGELEGANCSLCVVAHLALTVTPVFAAAAPVELVRFVRPPPPVARRGQPIPFPLYVRPPPALPSRA